MRADVVGRGKARDVLPDLLAGYVLHRPPDDRGDLSLVVEPVATGRPHEVTAMNVERAHRFREVGRGFAIEIAPEFDGARPVVQVHANDLAGFTGRQIDRLAFRYPATVGQREHLSFRFAPLRSTLEQNAAPFPARTIDDVHVSLPAGWPRPSASGQGVDAAGRRSSGGSPAFRKWELGRT